MVKKMQEWINTGVNILVAVSSLIAVCISLKAVSSERKARERLKLDIIVTKYIEAVEKLSDVGILLWTKDGDYHQKTTQEDSCRLLKLECDRLNKYLLEYIDINNETMQLGCLKEDLWEEITNYNSIVQFNTDENKRDKITDKKNKLINNLSVYLYSKKYKL